MDEPDSLPLAASSGAAEEEEAGSEPITLETIFTWLAMARPAAVLALLRDPEYTLIGLTAFAGFRVNAANYSMPVVRSRLAQEILKNEALAEKIRAVAEATAAPDIPTAVQSSPPQNHSKKDDIAVRQREEALKADRDRRRRERDEAREILRQTQQALAQTETARAEASEARIEQSRVIQQQQQRISRLERQVAKMQAEQTSLLKALRQDKVSAPTRASSAPSASGSDGGSHSANNTPWLEAVRHLLHKNKHDTALALALDVLRTDPDEASALAIALEAFVQKGQIREATEMTRRLLTAYLTQGDSARAAETMVRLLILLPSPAEAAREVRQWLSSLRTHAALDASRAPIVRLRGAAPAAYSWLESEVRTLVPRLADELMPPPGALGPDDALPLSLPGAWTARRLVAAVNANSEAVVTAAREALPLLEAETAARVWEALERAIETDDSALVPLRRMPRGPVVVDGSNAAWYDQNSYAAPRARLRPILELRRALRRRGFFPVLLYADAPLPFTIDEPDTLRTMLGREEIMLVDSGVDADEVLLREAKRCGAPLVTNDYMADWDPKNEVEKIQYTISLTGEAHLLK